jgi:hypothetical protein
MSQIALISRSAMTRMPWWDILTPSEQRNVLLATQSLTEEMQRHGLSKLAIGRELVRLREILEPKRKFCDYLRRNFPTCSVATAYRWIENYENAKQLLPERFVDVAMAQGYHVIDAEVISKNPPPRTHDRTKIIAYLAQLSNARRSVRPARGAADPDALARECVNLISARYRRLPEDEVGRSMWLESLLSVLLSELGANDDLLATASAVPRQGKHIRRRSRKIA